jgi:hypothetical protein
MGLDIGRPSGEEGRERNSEMSLYYSQTLVRLLTDERLREAAEARMARKGEQRCEAEPRRSILNQFRRPAPATCSC